MLVKCSPAGWTEVGQNLKKGIVANMLVLLYICCI